jgi:zinc/manganese transport system substrate-binding protein
VGNAGYLDLSQVSQILEVPTVQVTRAMGDVHPLGNPHYWLDPENGRRMAKAMDDKFSELRPADKAYFAQREADFDKRLTEAEKRWDAEMAPYKGRKVITYHRSWPNFCERFGLQVVDYVEPSPNSAHPATLGVNTMSAITSSCMVDPYFDLRTPARLRRPRALPWCN